VPISYEFSVNSREGGKKEKTIGKKKGEGVFSRIGAKGRERPEKTEHINTDPFSSLFVSAGEKKKIEKGRKRERGSLTPPLQIAVAGSAWGKEKEKIKKKKRKEGGGTYRR